MNEIFDSVSGPFVGGSILFILGLIVILICMWILFPWLMLRAFSKLQKDVGAKLIEIAEETHQANVNAHTIAAQQKRTNELLEWLGTIQQQPADSP